MKIKRTSRGVLAILMIAGLAALAQTQEQPKPKADVAHFVKDGLSFDYANGWEISDQSSPQLQYLTLSKNDYAEILVRSPRAQIDSQEKEAQAKQLIQDGFVQAWAKNFADNGSKAESSPVSIEIAGGPAEGTRLSAVLDRDPGHVDVYWRLVGGRMVQLTILGSDKQIKKSEEAWNTVRNSIQIEPPIVPRATPKSSKAKP
ncbi:MAG: hypothetical protein ABJC05_12160 [Pyrinomonadaceae bacterium]